MQECNIKKKDFDENVKLRTILKKYLKFERIDGLEELLPGQAL